MPDSAPPVGNPLGSVPVKNILDIADDTILLDTHSENPISFIKSVVAKAATPNTFRTRNKFYAKFLTQLGSQDTIVSKGSGMFDPIVAAIKASGGESIQGAKLFVCVAYIEELQHIPFPEENDFDAILRIASNGGVFKSFVYAGEIPKYGDPVVVSFTDNSNRREGNFEYPLVGGATSTLVGASGGGGGGGGSGGANGWGAKNGSGNYVSNCSSITIPKIKKKKKKKKKKEKEESKCPKYHKRVGTLAGGKPECVPMTDTEKQMQKEVEYEKAQKKLKKPSLSDEEKKKLEEKYGGASMMAKFGFATKAGEKKAKEAKSGKTKKPDKEKEKKIVPKASVTADKGKCAPFLGELSGPLTGKNATDWVEIKSSNRIYVRVSQKGYGFGPAIYGVAKTAHYINGLNKIPGGENAAAQLAKSMAKVKNKPSKKQKKYMANPATVPPTNGWFVGDISMFFPGRTPSHVSHQSGIGFDLSIPLKNGGMTVAYSPKAGFRFGYGKSYQDPTKLDWNSILKFLIYSVDHVKSITWFDEHITVAKQLMKEAAASGEHGYTSEIYKKIRRQISHSGCGKNRFCHANHFHIRMKIPGKWDHRSRYGRIDEKYWGEAVGSWSSKTKTGARWQEKNLPKKGY